VPQQAAFARSPARPVRTAAGAGAVPIPGPVPVRCRGDPVAPGRRIRRGRHRCCSCRRCSI